MVWEVWGEDEAAEEVLITVVLVVEDEGGDEILVLSHFVCRSHCNKWFCIEEHFQIIV